MANWVRNLAVAGLLAAAVVSGCGSFAEADGAGTGGPDAGAEDATDSEVTDAARTPDAPTDASVSSDAMDAADALDARTLCTGDAGCLNGSCSTRCPATGNFVGDRMRFESVGSTLRVRSLTDCKLYDCVVKFGDVLTCSNPAIGHVARVCSSSNPSSCALGEVFDLGFAKDDSCAEAPCTYTLMHISE